MVVLGETTNRLKAPVLADVLGTTAGFVPQVISPLVKAGWVRSEPGPTGGYTSCVSLGEVSILDVIEAVDGATDGGRCVVADRACQETAPCSLHAAWAELVANSSTYSAEPRCPKCRREQHGEDDRSSDDVG